MEEQQLIYFYAVGGALFLIGLVWLIGRAFHTRVWWGLLSLIPPFFLIFPMAHWKKARTPAFLALLGLVIALIPIGYGRVMKFLPVDLGPREALVEGKNGKEIHITLTGWDRKDYSFLAQKPDVVVLQIANPDVTNDTLALLKDCKKLREIDLTNTKIDDAGLKALQALPSLETLRLKGTAITDEGFKAYLLPMDSLKQLVLVDTKISPELIKEWKDAKKGRKVQK